MLKRAGRFLVDKLWRGDLIYRLCPYLFAALYLTAIMVTGEYKWTRTQDTLIWIWVYWICLPTIGGAIMVLIWLYRATAFLFRFLRALLTS